MPRPVRRNHERCVAVFQGGPTGGGLEAAVDPLLFNEPVRCSAHRYVPAPKSGRMFPTGLEWWAGDSTQCPPGKPGAAAGLGRLERWSTRPERWSRRPAPAARSRAEGGRTEQAPQCRSRPGPEPARSPRPRRAATTIDRAAVPPGSPRLVGKDSCIRSPARIVEARVSGDPEGLSSYLQRNALAVRLESACEEHVNGKVNAKASGGSTRCPM